MPEVKVDTKKQQMLDNLQKKLEKMKIEKDILSNQYKIEQRNRLLQSRDRIVQRRDIENIDNNRIKKVDKMIVDTNKDSSPSFLDKIFNLFTSNSKEEEVIENKVKQIEEKKIQEEIETKIQENEKEKEEEYKEKIEQIEKNRRKN